MSKIQERIKEYIDYKSISIREFCRNINVSASFLARDAEIASDKLLNIVNKYDDLSIEWLITGNGKMLKEELKESDDIDILTEVISNQKQEISDLKTQIREKDKQLGELIKTNLMLLEREKSTQTHEKGSSGSLAG